MNRILQSRSVAQEASQLPGETPAGDSVDRGPQVATAPISDPWETDEPRGGLGVSERSERGAKPLCAETTSTRRAGSARATTSARSLGAGTTERRSSSLDKPHITRPRRDWLRQVETETDPHRTAKAQAHWRRAGELRQERLAAGLSHEVAANGARWHIQRSYGQIQKFERVYDCGQRSFWLQCTECQAVQERTKACRVPLLCETCRGAINAQKRGRFQIARQRARDRAAARGLLKAGYGQWSEKLFTLTAPHVPTHSVEQRIALIWAAWSRFLKALNRALESQLGPLHRHVAWFRTFEWTSGADGKGHPHFHVWFLGPFLDQQFLKSIWRAALAASGYDRIALAVVIVDIRKVQDAKGAALEVIKYLTKDVMPDRSLVDSAVFARLYETVDGRRITQASAGFFKNVSSDAKCSCGAMGCFQRHSTDPRVLGESK